MSRASRTFAAVSLSLVLCAGCSLFKPTEPEPPSGSNLIPDYSTPLETLRTMADAVSVKAAGQNAYDDALLADGEGGFAGFRAYHLPEVAARHPDGSATWTKEEERVFFGDLVTRSADEYVMEFRDDSRNGAFQNTDDPDTASLYQRYTISTFDADGDNTGMIANGYAYISMRRVNSRWQVLLWKDIDGEPGDDDSETFGALRLGES